MELKTLLYQEKEKVAVITIHRPDKLNALNNTVMAELKEVFLKIHCNTDVRAVILTGAGEKAFCAGADIDEMSTMKPIDAKNHSHRAKLLGNLMENLGRPIIAAINGYALGGGCELAMSCHLRLASENAKFGQPEVNLGIIPGFGGTQRLARLVGRAKALELVLTGDFIDASEAHRIGLVNKVVPKAELLKEAETLAQKIASKPPVAVRLAIEAINRGLEHPLDEALSAEQDLFALLFSTEDMREGLRAFVEKRPPQFKGV